MKDKDSIQIEEAYKKVLKESDSGYPEHILKAAQELGRSPEEVWRKGGDSEPAPPKYKERKEGDEFLDNSGKIRIMIRMQDGKLIPAEKVFTSKKDGKQWERYKKADGKVGVKPYVQKVQQDPNIGGTYEKYGKKFIVAKDRNTGKVGPQAVLYVKGEDLEDGRYEVEYKITGVDSEGYPVSEPTGTKRKLPEPTQWGSPNANTEWD